MSFASNASPLPTAPRGRGPWSGPLRLAARLALAGGLSMLWGCAAGPAGVGAPAADPAAPSPSITVRVLAFNDFHGHLEGGTNTLVLAHPTQSGQTVRVAAGGAAALGGLIAAERSGQANTVVVSVGDLVGASPLASALFRDEPTIEAMNRIGIDLNGVGNHEFDRGRDELLRLVRGGCSPDPDAHRVSCPDPSNPFTGARFGGLPQGGFLAANVVDEAGRPLLPPYAIRRFGGIPVAFVGVVTRTTPTIVSPSGVAGLRFLDEAETLNRYAAELARQGVRALVAVVHEGGEIRGDWNDPACPGARGPIFDIERRLDPAYGVVLSGHTHQGYACRLQQADGSTRRLVTQAGSNGRGLTRLDLRIERAQGRFDLAASRMVNLPVVQAGNPPEVLALFPAAPVDLGVQRGVAEAVERAAPLAARPIGRLAGPAPRRPDPGAADSPAGRLIADAMLAATRSSASGGAQVAWMNPGGIRGDFTCQPSPCDVRFGDAFLIQPFGNSLVAMGLTGRELLELLEQQATGVNAQRPRMLQPSQGFTYRWRASAPAGQRASDLRLDGRPVGPDEVVRVVTNSFLAEGGDGFEVFTRGRDRVGGPLDLDALVARFQASRAPGSAPLEVPATPRVALVD